MKLHRKRDGRRHVTVAISPGHRDEVIARSDPKILEDAEDRLMRALCRLRGFVPVRAEAWHAQMRVADVAHRELVRIRGALEQVLGEPAEQDELAAAEQRGRRQVALAVLKEVTP